MQRRKRLIVFVLTSIFLFLLLAIIGMTFIWTREIAELDKKLEVLKADFSVLVEGMDEIQLYIDEKRASASEIEEAEQEVTVSEPIEEEVLTKGFIAIDPGHQGSWVDMSALEPNAPGSSEMKAKASTGTSGRFTGIPEYELNLDISLMLSEELRNRGYEVLLTREDNDTAISNAERAVKANESGADFAIRIHANGSDDSTVNGALTMVGSPDNPYIGYLYEQSNELATDVLNSYCAVTGFANLGIQQVDNMTGLNWSTIPSMILEMGFMTNESDDRNMADLEFRQKMVQGIADGIEIYYAKHPTTYTGRIEE